MIVLRGAPNTTPPARKILPGTSQKSAAALTGEIIDQGRETDRSENPTWFARDLVTETEMEIEEQETNISEIEVAQDRVIDVGMEIEATETEMSVTGRIEIESGTKQEIELRAEIGINHVEASTQGRRVKASTYSY